MFSAFPAYLTAWEVIWCQASSQRDESTGCMNTQKDAGDWVSNRQGKGAWIEVRETLDKKSQP